MKRMNHILSRLQEQRANSADTAAFLRKSLRLLHFNRIDGDYIEFGCRRFITFQMAWRAVRGQPTDRKLWAYSTFDRIPEPQTERDLHPRWLPNTPLMSEATFKNRCWWSGIDAQQLEIVKLIPTFSTNPPPLPHQFACLLITFQSFTEVRAVLRCVSNHLTNGVIIAFEHYHCGTRFDYSGAFNAFLEFKKSRCDLAFEPYRPFGLAGQSFVVGDT